MRREGLRSRKPLNKGTPRIDRKHPIDPSAVRLAKQPSRFKQPRRAASAQPGGVGADSSGTEDSDSENSRLSPSPRSLGLGSPKKRKLQGGSLEDVECWGADLGGLTPLSERINELRVCGSRSVASPPSALAAESEINFLQASVQSTRNQIAYLRLGKMLGYSQDLLVPSARALCFSTEHQTHIEHLHGISEGEGRKILGSVPACGSASVGALPYTRPVREFVRAASSSSYSAQALRSLPAPVFADEECVL